MQQFRSKGSLNSFALVLLSLLFSFQAKAQSGSKLFDTFDRPASLTLNQPSSGASAAWLETETSGANNYRVRLENNMLVMGSMNAQSGGVGSAGQEQASFDATGQYATTFNQANGVLTWAFNFRQSRSGTSGFGATTYGVAYVLGANKPVFTDPTANGYAVVIGNTGSPDFVKLVSFKNGLVANSNVKDMILSAELTETAYYSVKVTFDPCSKSWGLQVRNDGTGFQDPVNLPDPTPTFPDQTYTNLNLPYTGALYNHGTVSVTAFFDNIYYPAAQAQTSQIYTWSGAVSTDFNEAANWNPSRFCARTSDVFVFNNGGTVNITNVTSQEIGQLLVQNNTSLTLKAKSGTGTTQTLQINGSDQEDLMVGAGSYLFIDSNDPLELSLKSGATGSVSGVISLQNSAQNLGRAHRVLVADANALVMQAGSQFIAKNLSGEPFGTTGAANAVIFKANSVYVSKDGAGPFGLTTPNSKVVFEKSSLYRHEQTGTAPKLDGRVYADFELNVTGNLAIIWGTSAVNPTRIDNFTIGSGNMNVTLASGATPLPLHIRGNISIASGAAFNFTPAALANTSTITLNGSELQSVSGNLNLGQFANLEVNNPAGVTFNSNLAIRGNMLCTNGVVTVPVGRNLVFEDNSMVSGGSNLSYVNGKVIKTGDDAFTFPTGKNGYFAPIAISAPLNLTDQYVAEYFYQNPNQLFGTNTADSLVQISNTEYWDLERLNGDSEVTITLSYDPVRSTMVQNPQALRIAHFKAGNGWVNEGRVAINSSANYAFFATAKPQATFSPFTFGSIAENSALPVELLYFEADKMQNQIKLNWATATEVNSDYFVIERSSNGSEFRKIGEVKGAGHSNAEKRYGFTDKNPLTGNVYYRLKQTDLDGSFVYSKTVLVKPEKPALSFNLYPNPAQEILTITLNAAILEGQHVQVMNTLGKVVKTVWFPAGKHKLEMNIADLPAGTYLLKASAISQPVKFQKL